MHYLRNANGADMHKRPRRPEVGASMEYHACHIRTRAARGPAKTFSCELDCGNPARHWAYRGGDPDELYSDEYNSFYSAKPQYYAALCVKCHRKQDGATSSAELKTYRKWRHQTGLDLVDVAERIAQLELQIANLSGRAHGS